MSTGHTVTRRLTPVVLDQSQAAEMLRFALRWLPFGGGSDSDIFVEFGIPASEFYRRLTVILKRRPPVELWVVDHRRLSEICTARSIVR